MVGRVGFVCREVNALFFLRYRVDIFTYYAIVFHRRRRFFELVCWNDACHSSDTGSGLGFGIHYHQIRFRRVKLDGVSHGTGIIHRLFRHHGRGSIGRQQECVQRGVTLVGRFRHLVKGCHTIHHHARCNECSSRVRFQPRYHRRRRRGRSGATITAAIQQRRLGVLTFLIR